MNSDRIVFTAAEQRQAQADGVSDQPIRSILNVRAKMNYGDYRWNDAGVPAVRPWSAWISTSNLFPSSAAAMKSEPPSSSTAPMASPPAGRFPILAKMKDHRSSTYDAPMPYTLRLTGDGVSIHGSNVRWGFATHGCVGVPTAFAAKLFDAVKKGDEVVIVDAATQKRATA